MVGQLRTEWKNRLDEVRAAVEVEAVWLARVHWSEVAVGDVFFPRSGDPNIKISAGQAADEDTVWEFGEVVNDVEDRSNFVEIPVPPPAE